MRSEWRAIVGDASAVVLAWLGTLLVENVVLGAGWGGEFTGAWEVTQVRRLVVPMAVAGLAPASIAVVGWWRVALLAARGARLAQGALGALGGLGGLLLGLGVTHGRHFASWGARGPFVLLLVAGGVLLGVGVVPRAASVARWPLLLLAMGLALGLAGWAAGAFVLPRLYPAFHVAMLVACLSGATLVGLGARAAARLPARADTAVSVATGVVVVAAIAWTPNAAHRLAQLANVRMVVVEHAPLLGAAVQLAVRLRSPELEQPATQGSSGAPGEVARSLDWSGHDIVLLSVDALRADHVSAYGYARPTTPNLDALASEGTLFEAAYCPTPHTSYSVTSMMTGKYMRPLLALGLGEDSETWAQDLRLYGWRTAGFYPPAVFFIDGDRFPRFERETLGFEYAKVEFADPALREAQVAGYLDGAPADKPLLLWVHFFEPHEPYVDHPDHRFAGGASTDVDAYDGEVATADDGIGRIVKLVRSRRPGAAVLVTADHGEEFGEHGGRYHGTTVFEEQVHVPLVVVGPGVRRGARVASVVQTIDLLPTALSALGIPRPARLRGRDLGPMLAGEAGAPDPGFAFAETDDFALVASGVDRLVCERRAAACALYRPSRDPAEKHDLSADEPARFAELRAVLRGVERDQGRFEAAAGPAWPEALRRGMVGDADAAADVASLLDDADVTMRRKAAEVCFALHVAATAPQLRRALKREEDDEVRRWVSLALVRLGDPPIVDTERLLADPSRDWRRRAALALGERGETRSCETISAWWDEIAPTGQGRQADGEPAQVAMDLPHAQELLAATGKARCRGSVPALLRALQDVRARPYVSDALGALGDERARPVLLSLLAVEPYVTTRPHEAAALLALGAHDWTSRTPQARVHASLQVARGGAGANLVALLSDPTATLMVRADGRALPASAADGQVRILALPVPHGPSVRLDLEASSGGVLALWVASTVPLD